VPLITVIDEDRPLRRDAERNRRRILDAARELFAQCGLEVSLNDIAHHAGVGVGTVYRRFPDREQLIDSLFQERMEEMVAIAERAAADPDPWRGLVGFFEQSLELQAHDFGLKDLVASAPDGMARVGQIRARLLPLGEQIVRRAQASGQLRADVAPTDMAILQLMVSAVIDASRDVAPDVWRRFLSIVLSGLAAAPAADEGLPARALAPTEVDAVMSRSAHARRSVRRPPVS
jgi:AcrR family transcriptional regulator